MTPLEFLYLDYGQFGADDGREYIGGLVTLHGLYHYHPAVGIAGGSGGGVLGVQGNLWAEYIWDESDLEWKAFPRAVVFAEIAWTDANNKTWNRFVGLLARIELHGLRKRGIGTVGITSGEMTAQWKAPQLEGWEEREWDVTGAVEEAGEYQVAFVKSRGSGEMRVKDVRLWLNGRMADEDVHEGVAGMACWDIWTLLPALVGKVAVTAKVSSDCVEAEGWIYGYAV
jgi:hypothetical protein